MNRIQLLFLLSAIGFFTSAHAADTYDGSSNTLNIPLVKVSSTYYANVQITVGNVISVGSKDPSAPTYDEYNAANNQLTIPEVLVGTTTYYNVIITVGSVLSVGASCSTAAQCSSDDSTSAALYYGPTRYASAIEASYTPGTMVRASAFTNRSRYLLSNASSQTTNANYMQVGSTYDATNGYAVETGTLATTTTYQQYLQKLVQVVADGSGYFRLESSLHPNNAIDFDAADGNKLKFRNNFGKAATVYGYVTFAYDSSTKLLQAKKRYKYAYTTAANDKGGTTHAVSYTEDTAFSAANYSVNLSSGVYKLVASSTDATPLYAYNSALELGIPEFLNPLSVAFVTNDPAPFLSKNTVAATEGTSGSIYKQVNSTYRNQVATPGVNASTKTSADAMLAAIKSAVEASGEKLRYSTALYSAYRDATLAHKLVSDSIADGTPGQNLVPYVYFTNEKDTAGKYHPFMVVVNYGNQASPNGLKDVPHPPADGTGSYPSSKVTRFSNLENYVTLIPMKDYGVVTQVTDNTFTKNLWTARTNASLAADVYTYADSADNGLLIDGSVMFPAYNNNLVPSHLFGELTASGCHVGQGGGGPHCHFDGYQTGFSLGVYGDADYVNKTHPPMIGFGYDGIALFGKYRSSDTAMKGYSTPLDSFGAHDHDGIGYHYHAHNVVNHKAELVTFTTTLNVLMKGAYIGKTNDIPFFRASSNFSTNKYMGGTVK
ncbi:hypothetical protein [Limnohabitans sp. Rim8]|uniref:hypothetical protein n=1 Tax=Limnohabitans sp. Rim8 TaxID=1100718 RepID=UPI0025F2E3E7|nr:hypothetical protein [Limnohabitans sp. Rim8]